MNNRLHSLARKHQEFKLRIKAEMRTPVPDHLRLQALKRRKLRIKDEMQRLLWTQREARNPASGLVRPEHQ